MKNQIESRNDHTVIPCGDNSIEILHDRIYVYEGDQDVTDICRYVIDGKRIAQIDATAENLAQALDFVGVS